VTLRRSVDPSRRALLVLAAVLLPAFLVRLWLIRHFAEPDTDAEGHLGIARALLVNPTNVSLHWVYLPAYHFFLAGLLRLGLAARGIRVVNCVLASLVPVALWRCADGESREKREVAILAACLCAVSPLVNLLGTSAQQETLFTLLLLGTVWALDRSRFLVAGVLLALCSLVRYEIWGGLGLVVGLQLLGAIPPVARRLPGPLGRASRWPLVVTVPAVLAVAGWLLAHKLAEGSWFGFLRELCRYTSAQREVYQRGPLWFPVRQPLYVFGWLVCGLGFVGVPRTFRPSLLLPVGLYAFLVAAYELRGALGSARYYESLTPFVALAAAQGVYTLGSRWRWARAAMFALASWQLVALSTQLCRWTWPTLGDVPSVAATELLHLMV
jgi:hypothetical protein